MFPVHRIYLQNVSNLPPGSLTNWAFLDPQRITGHSEAPRIHKDLLMTEDPPRRLNEVKTQE